MCGRSTPPRSAAGAKGIHGALGGQGAGGSLGHVVGANKRHDGPCHTICRIPIREGFLTQSREGRPVAPLMGDFKEYDGGVTATQFFPINWLVADNDYAMLVRFTPVDVQSTEVEITYLVHQDAVEGRDYQVEEVTWLWRKTMEEDQKITEDNQAGVNSRFYRPGPHARDEVALAEFLSWYLDQDPLDGQDGRGAIVASGRLVTEPPGCVPEPHSHRSGTGL